ncbi:MAG: hypothetical protein IKA99_03670 [Clostridia bacterium]|nr:hypothetical protein [Clostridia bacterium]
MKDFNSFKSNKQKEEPQAFGSSPYEIFANLSKKYEGKSSDELMQAIIKQAEIGRKNGTLSDRDIDNFASTVAPLLNEKQRKTLNSVVSKLKKI